MISRQFIIAIRAYYIYIRHLGATLTAHAKLLNANLESASKTEIQMNATADEIILRSVTYELRSKSTQCET